MIESPQRDHSDATPAEFSASSANYRHTLLGRYDQRFLDTPPARIAAAILLAVVLVVPSVMFVHKIRQVDTSLFRAGGEHNRSALGRWLPTAALLTEDPPTADPYGNGHWFPTPPLVLVSLTPFSKMGYTLAGIVWAGLKVVGFVFAMALLVRELGRGGFPVPLGVLLMAGLFSLRPVVSDITHGNLNTFMMIWLALAWTLYMRGRDFWAGMLVGLAIVTKITPALVLVYFLYKRAWRVCLGAVVGLVLFFVVLPGLYLGFGRNFEYLASWYDMLLVPVLWDGYVTLEIANQSLNGVALRLLSNAGLLAIEHIPGQKALQAGMADMARPVTWLGGLLKPALSLCVVGALAWFCRRTRGRASAPAGRRDPRLLLEFGMVLIAMLLLSERTWKHHGATLPIVFLGVWYVLACYPWSDRFRALFVVGLVAQLAMLLGSSEGLLGERLADLLLDGGVFCWGLVLCFVQVAVLLVAMRRADQQSEPRP